MERPAEKQRIKRSLALVFLLLFLGGVPAAAQQSPAPPATGDQAPAQVTAVRYSRGPRYARVVIEASREIHFSVQKLAANREQNLPDRLFVDLTPAVRGAELPEEVGGKGILISRVRVGQFDAQTVRVVIDLKEIGAHQVLTLYDPFRIILDIYGQKDQVQRLAEGAATPAETESGAAQPLHETEEGEDAIAKLLGGGGPEEPAPAPPKAAPSRPPGARLEPRKLPLVILDPGHGGKDPGALGKRGAKEKDVVLAVAKRLAGKLKEKGYPVRLTRASDEFISLSDRTRVANEEAEPGSVFVSIHANANPNREASGVETYYWNVAVDNSKASTIARENFTNLDAVFRHAESDLKAILSDLQYKEKERRSASLASMVQSNLVRHLSAKFSKVRDGHVQHGPLYVLALTNIPAVLVETAFISNATEEKRLRAGDYQDALAEGILKGIEAFIREESRAGGK